MHATLKHKEAFWHSVYFCGFVTTISKLKSSILKISLADVFIVINNRKSYSRLSPHILWREAAFFSTSKLYHTGMKHLPIDFVILVLIVLTPGQ